MKVLRPAVTRATPVAEKASWPQAWLCGSTCRSAVSTRALARTGRATLGP